VQVWLGLWQKTDGKQPAAEATFGNWEPDAES
jgi:hypothetical protein